MAVTPDRFEVRGAFLLAGLRRLHDFDSAHESIPAQWADMGPLLPLSGQQDGRCYGANCSTDMQAGRFEHLTGVEVGSLEGLPDGMGRMRVPAGHYAVFHHAGPLSALRKTYARIFDIWAQSPEVRLAEAPIFELYSEDFDAALDRGMLDVWVPVAP